MTALDKLGFDAKAIVEFDVLLKPSYFLSPIKSTFSAKVAYARSMEENEEKDSLQNSVAPEVIGRLCRTLREFIRRHRL